MKLSYSIGKSKVGKEVDKGSFMLTNRIGGYAHFSNEPNSRYQGFFFNDELKMLRVVEGISLVKKSPIKNLKNIFYSVEREHDNGVVESFFMPLNSNSLVYELNNENEVDISIDIKESYDNRQFGRIYNIEVDGDKIIVTFTKRTNLGEDESEGQEEYAVYLAIKPDKLNYEIIDEWQKRVYSDDKERASMPYERYVYSALRLKAKSLVFSASKNREEAIKESAKVFENRNKLKKESERSINKFIKSPTIKKIKNNETKLAYISALNSLDGLRIKTKREEGIFAGLPWFFQLWARDELISLKGLLSLSSGSAKNVLMRYFFNLKEGKLRSRFHEESISSSDAVGWLYFRTKEAFNKKIFNKNEIKKITKILEENIGYLIKNNTKDDFAVCKERETWMDSLNRDGALIELQAFRLFMYKFLFELTKNKKYKKLEDKLKDKVRGRFWNKRYLADGLNDNPVRPNVFIAAYIYPELLSKEEWSNCFKHILPRLFAGWGGLTTVDKGSEFFVENHTGEDPKSYHNGDSWFWVNNLAALVLNRINRKKFKDYINKILDAGVKEILYSGISGCAAELSSAKELKSEGCLNQAWSNAMFIELIEEA
ncbi:hypothetical protein KY360_01485 [Candidatus Woesearchaeota archaeon]|nr:hypothetical protein [Candidatus Woesearchaeota archaeon]